MTEGSFATDKAIGAGMALAALTLIGAAAMYGGPTQLDRAWGFAAAMIAALLAVTAVQVFE